MGSYTPLYHNTFYDKKFKKLSKNAKLLFLCLVATNGLTGIHDVDPDITNLLLGGGFEEGIKELVEAKMVKWDPENNKVWVINKFKCSVSKNSNIIAGALNEISDLDHPFKHEFAEKYKIILRHGRYKIEEQAPSSFLEGDQLQYLAKLYRTKLSLKRFLMDKDVPEAQIERAFEKFLPNLK